MVTFLVLWLLFMVVLFGVYSLVSAKERRIERIDRERQRIASDAVRVKAALDQEAFRAARALYEAASRTRR